MIRFRSIENHIGNLARTRLCDYGPQVRPTYHQLTGMPCRPNPRARQHANMDSDQGYLRETA